MAESKLRYKNRAYFRASQPETFTPYLASMIAIILITLLGVTAQKEAGTAHPLKKRTLTSSQSVCNMLARHYTFLKIYKCTDGDSDQRA